MALTWNRRRLLALLLIAILLVAAAAWLLLRGTTSPKHPGGVLGTQGETDLVMVDGFGSVVATGASAYLNRPGGWTDPSTVKGAAAAASGNGGYILDLYGGLHAFGGAPAQTDQSSHYWPGWNIARSVALRADGHSGYVLDGFGGLHAFGGAPDQTDQSTHYWPGFDIARDVALRPDGQSGYVLDGYGGVHPFGGAPAVTASSYFPGWDIAHRLALSSDGSGGYVMDGWGGLHPFGAAPWEQSSAYFPGWDIARAVTMVPGSTSAGYVLDGFGGAHPFGGAAALPAPHYTPGHDVAREIAAVTYSGTFPPPTPGPTPTPIGSGHIHVFAYTSVSGAQSIVASLPSVVDGVSWIVPWAKIEPSPGQYDWSSIDQALAAASAAGKLSMVRVIAGKDSPSWVQPQLTMTFQPGGPQGQQTITMSPTYSASYISAWTQFIAAYGARYNGDHRIYAIQMPGGGWQGEMTLPQWQGWWSNGFSDAAMTSAWDTFIDAYHRAFPNTPTALDLGEPLYATTPKSNVLAPVLQHAESYPASQQFLQENGLDASAPSQYFSILSQASSSRTVGWQMWGGSNGPTTLHAAFTNAISSHASYVEVYLDDCTNPNDLAELQYLANG